MDRLGDTANWPSEPSDGEDAPRYALSNADRQHVTLENIELLADLDEVIDIDPRKAAGGASAGPPALPVAPFPAPLPVHSPAWRPPPALPPATGPAALPTPPALRDRDRDRGPSASGLAAGYGYGDGADSLGLRPSEAWVVAAASWPAADPIGEHHAPRTDTIELRAVRIPPRAVAAGSAWPDESGEPLHRPAHRARRRWARLADRWLLEALAVAGAAGAFVVPSAWLVVVALVCLVGGIVAFVRRGHDGWSLPGRVIRRGLRLLHPRSLIWAPVLTARTVIAAVVVPAGIAAVVWLIDEGPGSGTDGLVATVRLGIWADGARVAVALLCVMLLTSVGDGRQQRKAALRRWSARLSDGGVTALALVGAAVAATVVVVLPHPTDRFVARADGLGAVPAAFREPIDRMRDDVVTAELDTLASCLSHRTDHRWRTTYTSENPIGARDIARLVASTEGPTPALRDVATVVLSAHNLLAPWVETIEVRWALSQVVQVERATLAHREPLTDAEPLAAAASTGSAWLEGQSADAATVLGCSSDVVA